MTRHARKLNPAAPRLVRQALAAGALTGACLAATLGLSTGQALAATTAQVKAGTLQINGDAASDKLALTPVSPTTLAVDVGEDGTADFSFDRSTFTAVDVNARGGDDQVDILRGAGGTLENVTIDGGAGDDTLNGGDGAEVLLGGTGDDAVDGHRGDDVARLGGGADRFQWDPGDGSDTVEGQGGRDVLDFNGSNAPERIDVSANGSRVRFFRDVAAITMDVDAVERVAFRALGGADTVTVGDLRSTDLSETDVDLDATGGGGDTQADTVIANGTDGADRFDVGSDKGAVLVSGPTADVKVTGAEAQDFVNVAALAGADSITSGLDVPAPAVVNVDAGDGIDTATYSGTAYDDTIDVARNGAAVATFKPGAGVVNTVAAESLAVRGLDGADTLSAGNGIATLTQLTLDGGDGDDELRGGDGADTLLGGAGDDVADGNSGADLARLGTGDDRFQWDPGDGSDSVDGQGGSDALDFNGSNAAEQIDLSANGSHARLFRNVASITMDLDNIEATGVRALGGSDTITVGDLSGTDLKRAGIDLSATGGGGDAQADTVIANGTNRRDKVDVTRSGEQVLVDGFPALTTISGSEAANDVLRVNTLGGNDDVTVAPNVSDLVATFVDLGADE